MIPRLKEKYNLEISGEIQKELNLTNVNQIPKLEKIVINIGDGKAATDGRALESMIDELTKFSIASLLSSYSLIFSVIILSYV